ncbi:MAG: hypothetical protein M0008_03300 [Actinomycetota bacterium]|nr:hypothetical protein [Actinomycetota bacterium]
MKSPAPEAALDQPTSASFSLDDLYGELREPPERAVQALVVSEPGARSGRPVRQ